MLEKIKKCISNITTWIGEKSWKQKKSLSEAQRNVLFNLLKPNYYVIMTRRSNHLSTYVICLANLFLTGKMGYYSHVLMNLEDEVQDENDFRLIEATGKGVHYSTFDEVFDGVDAVALLKPKHMSILEWTNAMDKVKTELGKPYDTLFDLKSDTALSCVELVRIALMATPGYETKFSHFEKTISKAKNLAPHMFYDSKDFEVVYEIRINR